MTVSQYAPCDDFLTHPRKKKKKSEDSQGQGGEGRVHTEADVQRAEQRIKEFVETGMNLRNIFFLMLRSIFPGNNLTRSLQTLAGVVCHDSKLSASLCVFLML